MNQEGESTNDYAPQIGAPRFRVPASCGCPDEGRDFAVRYGSGHAGVLGTGNHSYMEADLSRELPLWVRSLPSTPSNTWGVSLRLSSLSTSEGDNSPIYEPDLNPPHTDMASQRAVSFLPMMSTPHRVWTTDIDFVFLCVRRTDSALWSRRSNIL
jgi:hypothetical protein